MPQEYFDNSRIELVAHISGREASQVLWKNNPCKCKDNLSVVVNPTSIEIGQQAELIIYLENSGFGVSDRKIYAQEVTNLGSLQWSVNNTGSDSIDGERSNVNNTVSGVSQATVSRLPVSVTSVFQVVDGQETGPNLFSSFSGKTIDLNTVLDTGAEVSVNYSASGVVKNLFTGNAEGTARIAIDAESNTEEGVNTIATVTISDPTDTSPPDDPGDPPADPDYYLTGPSYVSTPYFSTFDGYPYTSYPVYKVAGSWKTNADNIHISGLHFMSKQSKSRSGAGTSTIRLLVQQSTPSFEFEVVAQSDDGWSDTRQCVFQRTSEGG